MGSPIDSNVMIDTAYNGEAFMDCFQIEISDQRMRRLASQGMRRFMETNGRRKALLERLVKAGLWRRG